MTKLKKILCIICLAASFLLLAACGDSVSSLLPAKTVKFQAGAVEIEGTTDLTITLESGETALLDQLPELQKADFSGSSCVDEIYQWAQAHPDVKVKYTVTLPDGQVLSNSARLSSEGQQHSARLRALRSRLGLRPRDNGRLPERFGQLRLLAL